MRVAFNRREKDPTTGPYIFLERLAHHFNGRSDTEVVRANKYHDVHMITIQGSGRRADQYSAKKILRVDGVYFDAASDVNSRNRGIASTYHSVDGVIYQCEFAKRMLHQHFGPPKRARHEVVIFNGVSGNFQPIQDGVEYHDYGSEHAIVACARWRSDKRFESVMQSFLTLDRVDVTLNIFGEVQEKVEHPRIRYFGFVKPNDMWKYYASADLLLHLAYIDWCPNSVVEAIRCGIPVVTTHNGGVPELIQGNGAIVKGDPDYDMRFFDFSNMPQVNPRAVASAIDLILDERSDFTRERQDLSIEYCGQQYVDFFRRVRG